MDNVDNVPEVPFTAKEVTHNSLDGLAQKPVLIVLPGVMGDKNFCDIHGCN